MQDVDLELGRVTLPGYLSVPSGAHGVVVFAHGSGSSRNSPRNQQVAGGLNEVGLATLLFDLLTDAEAADRNNVFDIGLLADRMVAAVDWLRGREDEVAALRVGLFGASTGAAAALDAAAERPDAVAAVVSRGGRVDLASHRPQVAQPVLLVVGGKDEAVLRMNRDAAEDLPDSELEIVEGAGHLFEGPGELEQVTTAAAAWFDVHLRDS